MSIDRGTKTIERLRRQFQKLGEDPDLLELLGTAFSQSLYSSSGNAGTLASISTQDTASRVASFVSSNTKYDDTAILSRSWMRI